MRQVPVVVLRGNEGGSFQLKSLRKVLALSTTNQEELCLERPRSFLETVSTRSSSDPVKA